MQDLQQHTLGRYSQPSLAAILAQQHQDDIARAAEQRRVVTIALARSLDNGHPTRVEWARTFNALQTRPAAVRPAIECALRHRAVTSHPSTAVACCA